GRASLGNTSGGVSIGSGATANTVGGTVAGSANLISGNSGNGVYLGGPGTSGNVVLGNFIGTDVNGTANLGNANDGVIILNGATANTVGGTAAGSLNVISGNGDYPAHTGNGVEILFAAANVVLGNKIGTDVTGTAKLANVFDGVVLDNGATGNTIGGTAAGAGNLISGNGNFIEFRGNGLEISGTDTCGNLV